MARLSLYIEACECVGREIGADIAEIKSNLSRRNIQEQCLYFEGGIKDGKSVFDYLKKAEKDHGTLHISFSILSEMELLGLFLDRVFDEDLTRKLVPYRIRKRKPFRTQVGFNYEQKVYDYWKKTEGQLANIGIELTYPERERDHYAMSDIADVGQIVSRYVALDPVDLYVYALGVFLMVHEIYTNDNEFKSIINCIKDHWRDIKEGIIKALRRTSFPKFAEVKSGEDFLPIGRP